MSALALAPAGARERGEASRTPSLVDGLGGEPTLDELLVGVWEGLAAHRPVLCPVCGGGMGPEYGVHARPIGGHCTSCETTLT